MKLVLKRKEWHRLIGGGNSEEEKVYNFIDLSVGNSWVDFGEEYEPVGKFIKGAMPRMVNFSFKVKEIKKDCAILEVGGDAGTNLKDKSTDKEIITLKLEEECDFATKTRDFGIIYTLILAKDDDKIERISFREFNRLFLTCIDLDRAQMTIYPSLIYSMEDKYYNSAINYLQNHTITDLQVGGFKVSDIMSSYYLTEKDNQTRYLESLIILNTLEKAGDDAYLIYHPYIIE